MVFKLIRTDTRDPSKIKLSNGKHIIGRGKFLHPKSLVQDDATDKRVSRNHAELEVTEDTITLKSLHQNPCFYIRKNTQEKELLQQNCETSLCNGDRFGLIPDTFWYEIIHCSDTDSTDEYVASDVPDRIENGLNDGEPVLMDTVCEENNSDKKLVNINMKEEDEELNKTTSPSLLSKDLLKIMSLNPPRPACQGSWGLTMPSNLNRSANTTVTDDRHLTLRQAIEAIPLANCKLGHNYRWESFLLWEACSTEWVPQALSLSSAKLQCSHCGIPFTWQDTDQQNEDSEATQQLNSDPAVPHETNSPVKRCHSQDSPNSNAKKVKIEPDETGDARPGPSNDQAGASDAGASSKAAPASPAEPATAPPRERCFYGANCYRHNPQHKAQFSHPADGDWGAGERGACPYGAHCRRREPRHWAAHPPAARPPGMQMIERHGNIYYINAHNVNFYDDHFQVQDSDGDSVDFDYEFN